MTLRGFIIAIALTIPQSPPASVQGVVVKVGTNEPLGNATIELRRSGSIDPKPYTVETSDKGIFTFLNVQPGQYQVAVSRPGYVSALMGQRRPNTPADTITVASGDRKVDLRIALTPTGSISGRVTDNLGRPLGNTEVFVNNVRYNPNGRRVMNRVQSTITNDLGEYRLFWLAPGQYYVSALPAAGDRGFRSDNLGTDPLREARMRQPATALPSSRPANNPNAAVYFPGTPNDDAATPIDLRAGMDFRGADFVAAMPPMYRIRGVIIEAATGRPVTTPVSINLGSVDGGGGIVAPQGKGSFDFPGRTPGQYILNAVSGNLSARLNIEVRDRDVDVTVPLSPGYDVPGRIRIEGPPDNPKPNLGSLRVNVSYDPPVGPAPQGAASSMDGAFVFKSIPVGHYRLNLAPVLQNAYIKSMRLGDIDVLNKGLQIDRQPEGSLEILLSTNIAAIEGRVLDDRQVPLRGVTVVLLPDVAFRKRSDLYRTALTDASGRFQLTGVAPGDHKLFAWDGVEQGAWFDELFVRPHEERGIPVRVAEGSRQTVDLPLTP